MHAMKLLILLDFQFNIQLEGRTNQSKIKLVIFFFLEDKIEMKKKRNLSELGDERVVIVNIRSEGATIDATRSEKKEAEVGCDGEDDEIG